MGNTSAIANVFISYSHKDKTLCEKLISHLSILRNLQLIDSWHDGKIMPGSEWETEIIDSLNRAQIILLLISSDFMDSHFCYNIEAARAMERYEQENVRIIPIILRPVEWQGAVFSKLQVLPAGARPITSHDNEDEAFSSVAKEIRRIIETPPPKQKIDSISSSLDTSERIPLPTHPKSIVQREEAVKDIYTQLTQSDINALVLTGIGGIGKSTLASLIYAYTEKQQNIDARQFTAQTIWVTIKPGYTTTQLVANLFKELGGNQFRISRLTPIEQTQELFHLLNTTAQVRLIILNQFENLLDPQKGFALPECAGIGEWLDTLNSQPCRCRILLTSRIFPRGTHEYTPTYLQEYAVRDLNLDEGTKLLRKQGLEIPNDKLQIAIKYCQGHALSLTLLAPLLLKYRIDLIDPLEGATNTVIWKEKIAQKLLDDIFKQLNTEQQKLLSAFSVYREPVSLGAAETVLAIGTTGTSSSKLDKQRWDVLEVLFAQNLLQAYGNGLYQPHAIVADYARDHIKQSKQANHKALLQAHARAARYYQQLAQIGVPPLEKRRHISEIHPLVEAVWHLCQAEQWQQAYNLLEQELFVSLKRLGGNLILLELYQQFLPLEKWHPANLLAANMYGRLGDIYRTSGQIVQAQHYLQLAVQFCEQEKAQREDSWGNDDLGRICSWALNNLGRICNIRNEYAQAQIHFEYALTICQEPRDKKDKEDKVTTLNELANTYRLQGHYETALKDHEQALEISREIKDEGKEATSLKYLGDISASLEQKEQALKYYQEALKLQKKLGYNGQAGKTLRSLGVIHSKTKQQEKAIVYYSEALEMLRQAGDRLDEAETSHDLAQAYEILKNTKEAHKHFSDALRIYRELDSQEKENRVLLDLGMLYFKQDNFIAALACFLQAQQSFEKTQNVYVNDAQKKIAALQKKIGKRRFVGLRTQVENQLTLIIEQSLNI